MGGVTQGPPSGLGIAGGVTTRGVATEGMGVGGACLNKLPPTGLAGLASCALSCRASCWLA